MTRSLGTRMLLSLAMLALIASSTLFFTMAQEDISASASSGSSSSSNDGSVDGGGHSYRSRSSRFKTSEFAEQARRQLQQDRQKQIEYHNQRLERIKQDALNRKQQQQQNQDRTNRFESEIQTAKQRAEHIDNIKNNQEL